MIKDNIIKKMDEKKQLLSIRILIVIFIAISAVIAIIQYKSSITFIAQLMGVSWGALAGSFLAPFLYSLYWKKVSKASVWVSFIFGSGFMTLNMLMRGSFPALLQSPINAGAFTMVAGLIIVPVVSAFTKKPDAKLVEDAFASYNETHEVKRSTALEN